MPALAAHVSRVWCAGLLVGAIGASAASSARAVDEQAFFQGKQIRIFTMGSPGGGYDTYTRTVGAYLERKLGAKVITTNEPMAGGMIAMNRTMNAAPDGLTLLLTGGEGLVTAQLYGLSGVNYDVRTHHTNMDTYERVKPADLQQCAMVLASFAYHAAVRTERIPLVGGIR